MLTTCLQHAYNMFTTCLQHAYKHLRKTQKILFVNNFSVPEL